MATAIVMAAYVLVALVLNLIVANHLVAGVDARLHDRLQDVALGRLALTHPPSASEKTDVDDAPLFVWSIDTNGKVAPLTPNAPALPARDWGPNPVTLGVGTSTFRLATKPSNGRLLVAGESMAGTANVRSTLLTAEILFGAVLAAGVFAGSTIVGLRASAPSELVRRRQAEFTADASHELRTPLSVIEAELGLALDRPRDAAHYRAVLERVGHESLRLRRIVEDLLWLARADSDAETTVSSETADVATIAQACVHRFSALAETSGVTLSAQVVGGGPFTVQGSPDDIDRLIGVLVDNACKFAGRSGTVEVTVRGTGNRVELQVDDSGPGIPEAERDAVFDRFHRATEETAGTGLGLAIADSVVRSTQGKWRIGTADLGGARMEISWRKAPVRVGTEGEKPLTRS
jgi:signal transduction histidine kinase